MCQTDVHVNVELHGPWMVPLRFTYGVVCQTKCDTSHKERIRKYVDSEAQDQHAKSDMISQRD